MPPEIDSELLLGGGPFLAARQQELLRRILAKNAGCEFGRSHGFGEIQDAAGYRARVPLAEHEDLRARLDRMAAGERGVLTSERVTAFFKTSGSASRPKLIPVTSSFLLEKTRAFGIFWHLLYRDHPGLRGGRWIANFGDHAEREPAPGGAPILSETSFWNERMQGFQPRERWPIPPVLRTVADPELRFYAAARFALAVSLQGILSLNPSTLVLFARTLEERWDDLLEGLAAGKLGWRGEIAPELRERLEMHLEALPERARELRAGGPRPWRRVWEQLELVVCWRSRGVAPYLRLLEPAAAGVAGRDYITQASEAIVAIPVRDGESGGLLAHTSHFFEFIPESEVETPQPATRLAHELEEGQTYEVVVTTGGGLYRYRLGDLLRVSGFEAGVPHLEFLTRKGQTSSLTGEKLTERQVLDAAETLAREDWTPERFLCFPRSAPLPHYGVLVSLPADLKSAALAVWLGRLDRELGARNGEYAAKRGSGRLGPPRALEVVPEAFDRLRRRIVAERGISEEQLKLGVLARELDLDAKLDPTDIRQEIDAHRPL